jgi:hypothetical protein
MLRMPKRKPKESSTENRKKKPRDAKDSEKYEDAVKLAEKYY